METMWCFAFDVGCECHVSMTWRLCCCFCTGSQCVRSTSPRGLSNRTQKIEVSHLKHQAVHCMILQKVPAPTSRFSVASIAILPHVVIKNQNLEAPFKGFQWHGCLVYNRCQAGKPTATVLEVHSTQKNE